MSSWSQDRIEKIAASDDLHFAPYRDDGVTYGTPTWIWSVVVDGALYLRAYNGAESWWYKAASRQRAGRITVAGQTIEVVFEPARGELNDRIDDAYRSKYASSPYLKPMISDRAWAATVRISPKG